MKKTLSIIVLSLVVYQAMFCMNVAGAEEKRTEFIPDESWPDNNGVHINAHGGGILFCEGKYYWFGEHKGEGTKGNQAYVGVHCYSSTDLYNWTDEGIALKISEDPKSEIAAGCILERPKVIFNEKTKKFVMWFHLEPSGGGYNAARSGVAVADTVLGPYKYVKSMRPNAGNWPINVREEQKDPKSIEETKKAGNFSNGENPKTPQFNILGRDFAGGQHARDMTLFLDDDGKAYHIYSSEHNSTLHISQLSDDFLDESGKFIRVFENRWMEAPAVCKRNGKYYMMTSGCTGWAPNAARSAVADSIWGPWKELKNPCVGINPKSKLGPEKTFGGQSTFILPVQGKKDAYIMMIDVWRPKNQITSGYIWLPMQFTDDGYKIEWMDKWDLSVFDQKK
jgi:beta-xylosidase